MINRFLIIAALITSLFIYEPASAANRSKDTLLLDGIEDLVSYGMDTTGHWWAITAPYSGQFRLTIDGVQSGVYYEITNLTFSPDGNKWAYFGRDIANIYLVTNDTTINLPGTRVGEIAFSPNSEIMIYSFYKNDDEFLRYKDKEYNIYQRLGRYYLSRGGERIAYVARRAGSVTVCTNGVDGNLFESVNLIGFWHDGQPIYAASSGGYWELYKGKDEISDAYKNISSPELNINGDVVAFVGKLMSGRDVAVTYSDEYYEPLISKAYDQIYSLKLHPSVPLTAFRARQNSQFIVVQSSVEYSCTGNIDDIMFTHDGSELCFICCGLSCSININGKKFPINSDVSNLGQIAIKPKSRTFAYTTSTSLVARIIEFDELIAGMMVDITSAPRYNWRTGRYEALGQINQRLYLLTIKV
jgi:hypothetical protein